MTEIHYRTTAVVGRTSDLADRGMRVVIEAVRRENGRMPVVIPAHWGQHLLNLNIGLLRQARSMEWPVVIGACREEVVADYPRHFAAITDYMLIAQEDGLALVKDRPGKGVPFPVVQLA